MKKNLIALFILITIIACYWGYEKYGERISIQNVTLNSPRHAEKTKDIAISNLDLTGRVALLIDDKDGTILYEKNANERIYPASTTKILTALLALEHGDLDEEITVGDEVNTSVKGESTAYLVGGRTYTLRDLLAGLMLPSGNDAARTIAIHIGKKIEGNEELNNKRATAAFVDKMNEYAEELGAKHSHFVNPNGLHNNNHYTTAYDMAIITKAAMKQEGFMEIVSKQSYQSKHATFKNTNQLLDPETAHYFEGVNGIKTGFTDEAGRCLISSIKVDGRHLVALVFDSTDEAIFEDATALLSAGITYGG
ncbi:D-alanyl-D-alanine carboxypeptidase family protein [Bacillus sp. JJ722]|uniref:D-alanyl-D-alanine carboxypeptidase family protein n=1 Tax=Bacillus sp. JJ722 TaxID=3122973 RepID=UPI002FFF0848